VVESLARPGGNATGVSQQATDTGGKRLELLYEAVGGLRRVAVLVNVGNLYTQLEIKELALAASNLGIELVPVEVRRVEDIVPALIVREHVDAGGPMSYGPSFVALYRRSAEYVDRILRGTKPSDIPVEQPTKFDLIINLVTAKSLGIEIPSSLLARADEVIE